MSAAFAVALSSVVAFAQSTSSTPLGLFPVRAAWDLHLNNVLSAPPSFAGTRAYFPIDGDRLAAYDLGDGGLKWLVTARPLTRPAIGDGLIYLAERDRVRALDEATGAVRWQLPTSEPLDVPLVWDNEWLLAASSSGTVMAFRARDGGLIWHRNAGAPLHAPPALSADRVYLPMADNRIIALQVETGQVLWERRIGGPPNEILALEDKLYLGANDNYFYCIRAASGDVLWRWSTGGDVIGLPVADERRVYFVSFDNVLRALDRNSGGQRWKRGLTLRPTRGPIRAGDVLIVSGISPTSPAYALKDGSPAGDIGGTSELAAAPHVIAGGTLPVVVLVARDATEGTIVRGLMRSIEPATRPIAPLPNPIQPVGPPQGPRSSTARDAAPRGDDTASRTPRRP